MWLKAWFKVKILATRIYANAKFHRLPEQLISWQQSSILKQLALIGCWLAVSIRCRNIFKIWLVDRRSKIPETDDPVVIQICFLEDGPRAQLQ